MESRSPNVTLARWSRGFLLSGCLFGTVSGCVLGNDSNPPVLSVDLLWDRSPQANRFSEGTCESASVVWMNWQLKDDQDRVVVSSEDQGAECQNGFDFVDVGPGRYHLTVAGYDDKDQKLWQSTCQDDELNDELDLERFDVLYSCKVEQSPLD